MTPKGILSHVAIAVVAASAGWWLHARFAPRSHAVMSFTDRAPVVDVKGKTYSFSDLPIELQHRIHGSYLQAHSVFKSAVEDFAARVSVSGGSVPDAFDWKKEVEKSLTEDEIKRSYENIQGFKQLGPLSDAKVRAELERYLKERNMSLRISEETSKLKKENALKFIWNLPLAPRIDLETSGFPVIEVGPEGAAAIDSNIEVSFNYARANSEGAFLAIFRAAEKLQRRIKVRLMFESTGTTKETEAIKLIQCLANNVTFTREAWIVHLRTLQELPRVADDTPQVPLASFFPGDPDLVKRVSACEPRSLDDKLLDSHARVMASLKNTKSSSIFVDGQRLSEFDPRGTDGILEALLASRLQGQRQ